MLCIFAVTSLLTLVGQAAASTAQAPPDGQAAHTVSLSMITSDHGPVAARAGWGVRGSRFGAGLDLGAALAGPVALEGFVLERATRLRVRAPLLISLGGDERLHADLVFSPGLRSLSAPERSTLAATAEVTFMAQLALNPLLTINTGATLPFAQDLTGAKELALFPGLVLTAGLQIALSDLVALHSQVMLAAPEGYGGDGAKSVLEVSLGVRFALGAKGAPWIQLPESL